MIPFGRACASGRNRRVVMAMFAQGGKSETFMDIIGQRMDQAPVPILYVGPNKQYLNEQWSPRLEELLETKSLKEKLGRRQTKTRKTISGVPLRLAHAGSSTALKADGIALVLTDEADELMANVRGQGDPVGMADLRGETYADFTHGIVSTPSVGPSEVERDPVSGLEFWAEQDPDEVNSKIWKLWQEGTRYHWAVPCLSCGEYFIPRFQCLHIPRVPIGDGSRTREPTASEARRTAELRPPCGCVLGDPDRMVVEKMIREMNARGVYVAPGQRVDSDGNVTGDPPASETVSFWVSGLCSPFKTWGDRAATLVTAQRSGEHLAVQTIINGGFGELWAPVGGDVPEWEGVKAHALPYKRGEVPDDVRFLTAGIDVQGNRLVYVVRGWGYRQESWLIAEGEIWGDTSLNDVWDDLLEDVLRAPYGGLRIRLALIDTGFRPGKKFQIPEHKIYDFCRANSRIVRPAKGFLERRLPVDLNRIDIKADGSRAKFSLQLARISTDYVKSFVHEQLRRPTDQPGGWHVHQDVSEGYCRQIVSEARISKPGNGFAWIQRGRENHFLDCEGLSYAAAMLLGVQRIPRRSRAQEAPPPAPASGPDTVDNLAEAATGPLVKTTPSRPPTPPRRPARRVVQSSYM